MAYRSHSGEKDSKLTNQKEIHQIVQSQKNLSHKIQFQIVANIPDEI